MEYSGIVNDPLYYATLSAYIRDLRFKSFDHFKLESFLLNGNGDVVLGFEELKADT